MARLKLLDLRCIKPEERGGDEAYLVVGGEKVWKTDNIEKGDVASLRSVDMIDFDDKVKVELWDQDTGFLDKDDHLGTFYAKESALGQDELDHSFDEEGAEYELIYKVLE